MSDLISGSLFSIVAVALPVLATPKMIYGFGYNIGGWLLVLTAKTPAKIPAVGKIIVYVTSCVADFFEGSVDRLRSVPSKYNKDSE